MIKKYGVRLDEECNAYVLCECEGGEYVTTDDHDAEVAKLSRIADRLPITADGIRVIPMLDAVYFNGPVCPLLAIWYDPLTVITDNGYRRDGSIAVPQYLPVSQCYSTREAAEAANVKA